MKPSNLQTPRTLNECHFVPGSISADYDDDLTWKGALLKLLIAFIFVAVFVTAMYRFG